MPKNVPIVIIEWEDSAQPLPQWQWMDDLQPPGSCQCITVGFLVKETPKEKSIALSMADDGKQAAGIMTIPTACIKSMKPLTSYRAVCDRAAASKRKRRSSLSAR